MRVVLDVNLLVSARLTPAGEAHAILMQAETQYTLVLSEFIVQQVERVLQYPRLQSAFPHLTPQAITDYLTALRTSAILVLEHTQLAVSTDPEDNRILAVAVDGQAEYVVTRNLSHFPKTYGPVTVLSPAEFQSLIRHPSSE